MSLAQLLPLWTPCYHGCGRFVSRCNGLHSWSGARRRMVEYKRGEQYQATIIDTWAMTTTPIKEPVVRGAAVLLPGKPYQALILQRAV